MITKKDILILVLNLILTLVLLGVYAVTSNKTKSIVTVDVKTITDEFMRLATKSKLEEHQMDELVSEFTASLGEGILNLSNEHIILAKRAVVSDEIDLTNDLRDYVAGRITKRTKE